MSDLTRSLFTGFKEVDVSLNNEYSMIRHHRSSGVADWSVPPTIELSPTSLTSSSPDLSHTHLATDDSSSEIDLKRSRTSSSLKRRYRAVSFSCPILPFCRDQSLPITPPYKSKSLSRLSNASDAKLIVLHTRKKATILSMIQCPPTQQMRKRRCDASPSGKRVKVKSNDGYINPLIISAILDELIA